MASRTQLPELEDPSAALMLDIRRVGPEELPLTEWAEKGATNNPASAAQPVATPGIIHQILAANGRSSVMPPVVA